MRKIRWKSIALAAVCLAIAFPQFAASEPKSTVVGVVFLCGAALYVFHALRSSTGDDPGASKVQVSFDDSTITVRYGNGERRSIAWNALTKVGITTTDEGPVVDDVFWGLHSQERVEVVYPSEAIGAKELLGAMQARLKDFNNEALIRAMGSTANDRFVVWQSADVAQA
ncbi:MAG TPA: hypothetical protein VIN06_03970 [Devosia sp.]